MRLLHSMVYKSLIRLQGFLGKLRTSYEVSFFYLPQSQYVHIIMQSRIWLELSDWVPPHPIWQEKSPRTPDPLSHKVWGGLGMRIRVVTWLTDILANYHNEHSCAALINHARNRVSMNIKTHHEYAKLGHEYTKLSHEYCFSSLVFRDSSAACIQEKGSCDHSSAWDTPVLPSTSLVPSPPPQLLSLAIVSSVLFILQVMIAVGRMAYYHFIH